MDSKHDVKKLPLWAQERIESLEYVVQSLTKDLAELAGGQKMSHMYIQRSGATASGRDERFYLDRFARVFFVKDPEEDKLMYDFSAYFDEREGCLRIATRKAVHILPVASNYVKVYSEKWK